MDVYISKLEYGGVFLWSCFLNLIKLVTILVNCTIYSPSQQPLMVRTR